MSLEYQHPPQAQAASHWEKLEREERSLWRTSLFLMFLLAVGVAAGIVGLFGGLSHPSTLVLILYLLSVASLGVFVWRKERQIAGIRTFLRGLAAGTAVQRTPQEFDKLFDVIVRSQSRFRDLVDSLDHAVFTLSLTGEFQVANRRCVEIFGAPFPELIHHSLDEFLAEPTIRKARSALPEFLANRSWAGVLHIRLKKTGQLRFFDAILHAVLKDGQPVGVSGLARDVTELRASEIRFSELFESLQEGIFFTTPEGQILDANPAFVRMLGFQNKEELRAANMRSLYVNPDERVALIRQVEQQGTVHDHEISLRRKDGSQIRCLDSCSAIRDNMGRVVRFQGTMIDISHRVEMEKRLHQEQEFVRRLVASFPDAIGVLDTDLRYTFLSGRLLELLGHKSEDFLGRKVAERVNTPEQQKVIAFYEGLVSGKARPGEIEYHARHHDGSLRAFRTSASPLFDEEGKITGVVASTRDVTGLRQIEQQLLQKEKLAAMGQMIAGVAHELNNPLTAILGVSDLLRERAPDDIMRRQVDLVLQQARRAANIVQGLMAFSRPSAPGSVRIQLEELAGRAIQQQELALREKRIEMKCSSEPNLPPVEGDSNLLLQMIQNLLVNAQQAISSVRDHGVIRVHSRRAENGIALTVEDDGPGIPVEIQKNIFDPFFTTKRPGGGAGLGLTIAMAIAKEHGGLISVASTPGAGATFRVSLPAADGAETEETSPARAFRSPAPSSLRGHSVLVVDDEESIRELVVEGLSARGMAVESVATSEEALSILATRKFDAILCDFNLPGLNGEKLFERLRAQPGGSPARFVFMTGDMLDSAAHEKFAREGARVVQKPFQLAGLAAILGEVLEPQMSPAR